MFKLKLLWSSMILGLVLCALPIQSEASTFYTVKPGDSLWSISSAYHTTVANLQSSNNLSSDRIMPGQSLSIGGNANSYINDARNRGVEMSSRGADRSDEILDYAKRYLGVPYASGGQSSSGFDCSGYVKYIFSNFGINLPRTAAEQYYRGQAVSSSQAKPGDIVAFNSGSYISHVGIYLGNGSFISATSSRGIAIDNVYGSYWGSHFLGFSRIIP